MPGPVGRVIGSASSQAYSCHSAILSPIHQFLHRYLLLLLRILSPCSTSEVVARLRLAWCGASVRARSTGALANTAGWRTFCAGLAQGKWRRQTLLARFRRLRPVRHPGLRHPVPPGTVLADPVQFGRHLRLPGLPFRCPGRRFPLRCSACHRASPSPLGFRC